MRNKTTQLVSFEKHSVDEVMKLTNYILHLYVLFLNKSLDIVLSYVLKKLASVYNCDPSCHTFFVNHNVMIKSGTLQVNIISTDFHL
jgi:hypothetical protein